VDACSALAARHRGQTILVVAHGGVLDCLYRAATRVALDAPRSWQLGNATVNRLLHTDAGFTLVGWNDAGTSTTRRERGGRLTRASARRRRGRGRRQRRTSRQAFLLGLMTTQLVMSRFHDVPSAVCPEPTMCWQGSRAGAAAAAVQGRAAARRRAPEVSKAFTPELLAVGEIVRGDEGRAHVAAAVQHVQHVQVGAGRAVAAAGHVGDEGDGAPRQRRRVLACSPGRQVHVPAAVVAQSTALVVTVSPLRV
jgi:hypothetical protein